MSSPQSLIYQAFNRNQKSLIRVISTKFLTPSVSFLNFRKRMEKLSEKPTFFGCIKYAVLPWVILILVRYLYNYGFHYVSPDWLFIEASIIQLGILITIYLAYFAKSK